MFFKRPNFSTIFWKIFFTYWLATLLIMASTYVLVALFIDRDRAELQRRLFDRFEAGSAVTIYESGGASGLEHYLREQHGRRARGIFVLDEEFNELRGHAAPTEILHKLVGEAVHSETGEIMRLGRRWFAQRVSGANDKDYWFVTDASITSYYSRQRRPEFYEFGLPEPIRDLSLLLSLLVSGLVSFWLARNFTAPIRQLQTAVAEISSGDLSARVNDLPKERADELGELSRDFNAMAEQIEMLLGSQRRVLRDVSHELRSPLARLQIALELARKQAGEKENTHHERIQREADRLEELISQVLSLVKLSTQATEIEKSETDLVSLIRHVIEDAQYEAEPLNKKVRFSGPDTCHLKINAGLMGSALENILRNAVRFTPENNFVDVTLSERELVQIEIRDFGPGVPDSIRKNLFEPFYREAESRDRASGGYGLGLAIAERSVNAHNGTIVAENAQQGGLRIIIKLPKS